MALSIQYNMICIIFSITIAVPSNEIEALRMEHVNIYTEKNKKTQDNALTGFV